MIERVVKILICNVDEVSKHVHQHSMARIAAGSDVGEIHRDLIIHFGKAVLTAAFSAMDRSEMAESGLTEDHIKSVYQAYRNNN